MNVALAVLALPIAWLHLYLNEHFSADMLTVVVTAGPGSLMMLWPQPLYPEGPYGPTRGLYRLVFAPLIAHGLLHSQHASNFQKPASDELLHVIDFLPRDRLRTDTELMSDLHHSIFSDLKKRRCFICGDFDSNTDVEALHDTYHYLRH